jgi:hypothetical protein
MAVPTSALRVDAAVAAPSPKGYSERELREIAATVPAIYDRIADGWSPGDFAAARWSRDPQDQQVGQTYVTLFQTSPAGKSLAAVYDGMNLVVEKGNHRVRAARSIGVPVLPVWVSAPNTDDLDRVEVACARRIEREGSTTYREAHKLHESARQPRRQQLRERERDPEGRGPDRSGPEILR